MPALCFDLTVCMIGSKIMYVTIKKLPYKYLYNKVQPSHNKYHDGSLQNAMFITINNESLVGLKCGESA